MLPGGTFFYPDDIKFAIGRNDITLYPMPVKKLVTELRRPHESLRDYIANMVYVGVVAKILGIDLDKIYQALDFHFKGKTKPIDLNFGVIKAAYDWAAENLEKKDPYRVEPMDATGGYIMADGNTAAALGADLRWSAICSLVPNHTCLQPGRILGGIPAHVAQRPG